MSPECSLSPELIALIAALGGALIGGLLTLLANYLMHKWNKNEQNENRKRQVKAERLSQVEEQVTRLYKYVIRTQFVMGGQALWIDTYEGVLQSIMNDGEELLITCIAAKCYGESVNDSKLRNHISNLVDVYSDLTSLARKIMEKMYKPSGERDFSTEEIMEIRTQLASMWMKTTNITTEIFNRINELKAE